MIPTKALPKSFCTRATRASSSGSLSADSEPIACATKSGNPCAVLFDDGEDSATESGNYIHLTDLYSQELLCGRRPGCQKTVRTPQGVPAPRARGLPTKTAQDLYATAARSPAAGAQP